ncbi:MAG: hypothetical protein O7D86_02570 [Proteobacteria bacterium]|nr:hypothetical protein [Pseudomonadota bacterium]
MIHNATEFKEIRSNIKRKFNLVILLALAPTFVYALGLGKLDLNSALNEPFDARIQLLSPTADELDSLKLGLADSVVFARAKIDRPFVLRKLKFALRRSVDDGPDYIRVFSQEPIREPFLNFLVELSWSNGRLFREYTVLLDPPLYDPNARASEFSQTSDVSVEVETTEVETIDESDHKVVYADSYEQYISPAYTPSVNYAGGDYGPATGSDTLWSLATAMRPDTSISVNKMMLALLRANPDTFINQNINGLKRGHILRMPNESEIIALNNAEVLTEVQSQHAAWDDIRGNLSSAVTERPEVSSVPETTVPVSDDEIASEEVVEETDPELRLVAAEDTGEATQQVSSADSGDSGDLALAQESIQALTQENLELDDRLTESEALIEDLKRLLSLKDDELAALQNQMATAQAEIPIEEAMEEVAVAEEAMAEESVDEEVLEVIETEPAPSSSGLMGKIDLYIGPAKSFVLDNPMIGLAVAGVLLILIIVVVLMKFRKEPAETVHIDAKTEEAFPDFSSGDLGDTGEEVPDTGAEVPDSEAVTVLPDSEAETDMPDEETAQDDVADMDFELSLDDTPEDSAEEEIDLDGTVEIPKNVDLGMDDDDDESTVFVPRAAQPVEQSAEDEIATKLDLAKAYVELGDKDSAKTILDEVMAEGNDEQRKQADDLLGQI